LGAGIAGGADVILIPEIPYDVQKIADAIKRPQPARDEFQHCGRGRRRDESGRCATFSPPKANANAPGHCMIKEAKNELAALEARHTGNHAAGPATGGLTHLESRVTILGYVQRGGTPSRPTGSWHALGSALCRLDQ